MCASLGIRANNRLPRVLYAQSRRKTKHRTDRPVTFALGPRGVVFVELEYFWRTSQFHCAFTQD